MAQTQKKQQDMGTGDVKKLLLQLMIPAVVAQVVNLLYNIVDRIYIGHISGIGAAALTGVGLFTPILMLLNAFAMLIGSGGAPRTAIAMGQGDKKQAEKIVSNSFTMLLLFSVVLTIVFYAAAPTLLRLFGASDTTLPYALAYSRIYILGTICVLIVLGMNTFITAQGFAKISMLTTVIGAVINIVLDYVFIFILGWGMTSAALQLIHTAFERRILTAGLLGSHLGAGRILEVVLDLAAHIVGAAAGLFQLITIVQRGHDCRRRDGDRVRGRHQLVHVQVQSVREVLHVILALARVDYIAGTADVQPHF